MPTPSCSSTSTANRVECFSKPDSSISMSSVLGVKTNKIPFIVHNGLATSGDVIQVIKYAVPVSNFYQPLWSPNYTELPLSNSQAALPRNNTIKEHQYQQGML